MSQSKSIQYFFIAFSISVFHVLQLSGQGILIDSINSEDTPLRIEYTESVGISIRSTVRDGIRIENAGFSGVRVGTTGGNGFTSSFAGNDGYFVSAAGRHGFYADEATQDGFRVFEALENGLNVQNAGIDGVFVGNTGFHGIRVASAGQNGVHIGDATLSGLFVMDTGFDGVLINDAGDDGVEVINCMDDGLSIGYARGNGIRVGNADEYSMDIQGDKRGLASVENHVARIYNFNNEGSGDVLALKVNELDDPGDNMNFITFFKGGPDNSISNALGAIEGNGSGGVTFKTGGADFAEALTQIDPEEKILPGDVVGVHKGKISLTTEGADQIMVLTDRPAILGNAPHDDDILNRANVSFIGQVHVRVVGPVRSGDWLIQSGKGDGSARALDPTSIRPNDFIIGQAWETNRSEEEKLVNSVIGRGSSQVFIELINEFQVKFEKQQLEIEKLKEQLQQVLHHISN